MTLYESFSAIADFRRAQGQRTVLPALLTMICLAYMCGHTSKRKITAFAKSNEEVLGELLHLKHKVPSHVTMWTCLGGVREADMVESFNQWAKSVGPILQGQWVSGDGKSLASTVANMHDQKQSFTAVVSMFCQQTGLVQVVSAYRNDKRSEIHVLRGLLEHFKDAGVVIFLDALYCQKKRLPTSTTAETLTAYR